MGVQGLRRLGSVLTAMLLVAAWPLGPSSESPDPFLAAGWTNAQGLSTDPTLNPGSMFSVAQEVTGAAEFWNDGYTGRGVDVALIDTGVVSVAGLASNRVDNAPDLSVDRLFPDLEHLDAFGHGTHLAGIVAGRDGQGRIQKGDTEFLGMAPTAGIVNVKVGDRTGVVDVSQVIDAIDWVITNRDSGGRNIRVLLLAYGTDGHQAPETDPLTAAVERAWNAGIVVVVAAGNDGNAAPLRNPATDPFVIAVGATDSAGTYDAHDDVVTEFSSCGTSSRGPDLVAPGQSIVSLRVPGSVADLAHPEARVGDRFFAGSGTSQAAAVVAGAAALVIDQRPAIDPDGVKALLTETAQPIPGASEACQGAGLLDLKVARDTSTPGIQQNHTPAAGSGSLEGARGSHHISFLDHTLTGEVTLEEWAPFQAWLTAILSKLSGDEDLFDAVSSLFGEDLALELDALFSAWSGNSWGGNSWGGNSWGGNSWGGNSWGGNSWGGNSWGSNSWGSNSWS